MNNETRYEQQLAKLRSGEIRLISKKRAKKLWKKRGIIAYWCRDLHSYFWFSDDMGN
jgi:hypothetical protein